MNQRFKFSQTGIKDLFVCERKPIVHDLGSFVRTFCSEEFIEAGLKDPICQINQTVTRSKWSVRGMHFQHPPYGETKITTVLSGAVFDVAVDLRRDSPTFLHWHGQELSADNKTSLLIPEGFAHGFQTLTDNCEMLYLHTAPYVASSEGALNANDPLLAIEWPCRVTQMSERDQNHPFLTDDFEGVDV